MVKVMEIKWENNDTKNFTWKTVLTKGKKTPGQEEQLILL